MTTVDLKGHLLARAANLESAAPKLLAEVLLAEERLREVRGILAANAGAREELARTLALLDQPQPAQS